MDPTSPLTPFTFNTVQNTYVTALTHLFVLMNHYAVSLFYVLAGLEIAFFGIIWALKQQELLGQFLFKIIKLGFIFFLISHYSSLLSILVNGLSQVSFSTQGPDTTKLIFGPDLLWKYGFDSGISLLSLAVQYGTTNLGMTCIYLFLGFGILILFAAIACQVILTIISFYVLSLVALLFLPFGTFILTENVFTQALHGVFRGAVKIFVLVLIIGIGMGIWSTLHAGAFTATTTLDQPLGLFFTTLIIAILAWKVPLIVAEAVGFIGGELFASTTHSSDTHSSPSLSVSPSFSHSSSLSVATQLSTSLTFSQTGAANTHSSTTATAVSLSPSSSPGSPASAVNLSGLKQNISDLTKAVKVQKEGLSRDTLNKLKSTFKEPDE